MEVLAIFTLLAIMYRIGHIEYDKKYPQKSKKEELDALVLQITEINKKLQSVLIKVESLEICCKFKDELELQKWIKSYELASKDDEYQIL